jgi:hypothetical protein
LEKIVQYLNILTVCLLIVLVACLGSGCRSAEQEDLVIAPTETVVEIIDEETNTPPRATATGSVTEEDAELTPANNIRVVQPGVPFKIGIGETVRLGDSKSVITFEAIIQDSRCPIGVGIACFWEGVGEVQFVLTDDDTESKEFTLTIPGLVETPYTANSLVKEGEFLFKLLQLEPYPSDEAPIQPDTYQAQLLFEERQ